MSCFFRTPRSSRGGGGGDDGELLICSHVIDFPPGEPQHLLSGPDLIDGLLGLSALLLGLDGVFGQLGFEPSVGFCLRDIDASGALLEPEPESSGWAVEDGERDRPGGYQGILR